MLLRSLFLAVVFSSVALAQKAPPSQDFTRLDDCTYISHQWNDGDSFHVRSADGKEFIFRLYFVDAPESENSFPERVAEQASYFNIAPDKLIEVGKAADAFTKKALSGKFTVFTRWRDALGRSKLPRYYAFVKVGPNYLQNQLVKAGLARIYGTRTPLPDGSDSRTYLKQLEELEGDAKKMKRGGWKSN